MNTLLNNGDGIEREYASKFILAEFPSYETYWVLAVIPLTDREHGSIQFKSLADLSMMGKSVEDAWEAQLHYSVIYHLSRAYDLKKGEYLLTHDGFIELFGRLFAAIDVAQELIGRRKAPTQYRGSQYAATETCKDARKAGACNEESGGVRRYRTYRNLLVHSSVLPGIMAFGMERWVPKPENLRKYRNWALVATSGRLNLNEDDFELSDTLVAKLWDTTLAYLEDEWKNTLIPSVSAPEAGNTPSAQ